MQLVPFGRTRAIEALHGVGMHIASPIYPGPSPRSVVDEHRVPTPIEAVVAPTPRPEGNADVHEKSEANRTAYKESWPWRVENHRGIVVRQINDARIHR